MTKHFLMRMKTSAIIMAGGKGSRMKSDLPKVLHAIRGRTFLECVIDAASAASDDIVVVVGHAAEQVAAHLPAGVRTAYQAEQKGTGHAVACALAAGVLGDRVVVLPGDHPLLTGETVRALAEESWRESAEISLATLRVPGFEGAYEQFRECGRVLRDGSGRISGIVEYREADARERLITEVAASCFAFDADWLRANIVRIPFRPSGEYYLTDLVAIAVRERWNIRTFAFKDWREAIGVNTAPHLALAERAVAEESDGLDPSFSSAGRPASGEAEP